MVKREPERSLLTPCRTFNAMDALRPAHRALVHRKDHRLPLFQRHNLRPRLHPRPLFRQHELAAGEILARLRQQDRRLQPDTRARHKYPDAGSCSRPRHTSAAVASASPAPPHGKSRETPHASPETAPPARSISSHSVRNRREAAHRAPSTAHSRPPAAVTRKWRYSPRPRPMPRHRDVWSAGTAHPLRIHAA